jgi:hypothetical protein
VIIAYTWYSSENLKLCNSSLFQVLILIHEAMQIDIWKHKVFPHLIDLNGEPSNTFMLYSVLYHEVVAVSLLENILFHCESAETMDDTVIDLIDYAVQRVTMLLDEKILEIYEKSELINDPK